MLSLGIDIGYCAVKIALVDQHGRVRLGRYRAHRGQPGQTLRALLEDCARAGLARNIATAAAVGNGAELLARTRAVSRVNEVAALVEGALLLAPQARGVIEIGAQTAKYLTEFSPQDKSRVRVSFNSNCASGTGAFLEEQVSRLGLAMEDYSTLADRAGSTPRIAGRCSVFAKTDITHHQQEGVPVPDILRGLAYATCRNYRGAVMRKLPLVRPLLFVGGVSRNEAIVTALRDILETPDIQVHEHSACAGAVGAAALAAKQALRADMDTLLRMDMAGPAPTGSDEAGLTLAPLADFGTDDASGRHNLSAPDGENGSTDCWLGIDVGSTSTNLVLSDDRDRILAFRYLRTSGDPVAAVRKGLAELREEVGGTVRVAGAATTGSGRHMIGRLVGADLVRDEITAQARAALAVDPTVDTVFEIGGQDSKFIALENGVVTDFQMNKVCAAGTGSFIEEQAKKLGVPLEDFGPLALAAENPVNLGERCTVFMEAGVSTRLGAGARLDDLAAGLCYSIIRNYLNRVVGRRRIGRNILFQGGLGHNQGVVNALRALTGKAVSVPPFFSVTGAWGAAILAREDIAATGRATAFKGFEALAGQDAPAREGGAAAGPAVRVESGFSRDVAACMFRGHDPVPDPAKPTVGIPRALFTYGMFPMFAPFFSALGCNVLLSAPSSEETVRLAQEYSLDETCYPVKLINGHVAELAARGVDHIFFPDLHTVFHPGSKARRDYGCAYMQVAFRIVSQAMNLKARGIGLLAPTIAFGMGPEFMRNGFLGMGRALGRGDEETMAALGQAMRSYKTFEHEMEARAAGTLAGIKPGGKTFVMISKIYGVADQMLHMGVPDRLREMGHEVLPFHDLPDNDIFTRHPNMYWPFGQHMLFAARAARHHPDLYAVLLTHHGCGPDTVLSHYVREIMGPKPYLAIEVDEHSSGVGVMTRVEAFVNSLEKTPPRAGKRITNVAELPRDPAPGILASLGSWDGRGVLYVPRLFPYTELACAALGARGGNVLPLAPSSGSTLARGRRHTTANEYFSMAALLGDILATLENAAGGAGAVLVPQNEGAEVDGQYARFMRAKLDEEGFGDVVLLAPFLEDLPALPEETVRGLFHCLLAGDIVLATPPARRAGALDTALDLARSGAPRLEDLVNLARAAARPGGAGTGGKAVFAVGEPLVLYNDMLNDGLFAHMEEQGHSVLRAPLAEALWMLWRDHATHGDPGRPAGVAALLDELAAAMAEVSRALGPRSPFGGDAEELRREADTALGFYDGAFGRWRAARMRLPAQGADGVLAVSSMYENTGISLDILHRGAARDGGRPVLHLVFDGTRNESDRARLESFLYYL